MNLSPRMKKLSLLLIALILFFSLGLFFFVSTGRDDTHITYFPAWTLANSGQILNYNGQRLEQSSSLLFVLLLGFTHRFTQIPLPDLGSIFSITFGLAACLLTHPLAKRLNERLAFPALFICASSVFLIYWSFSGMEMSLAACLLLGFVLAVGDYLQHGRNQSLVMSLLLIPLLLLVRPEAPFILLAVFFAFFLYCGFDWLLSKNKAESLVSTHPFILNRLGVLFLYACLIQGAIFLFRVNYFSSFFPQPVSIKAGGISLSRIFIGFVYTLRWFFFDLPMVIPSLITLVEVIFLVVSFIKRRNVNIYAILSLSLVLATMAFVLLTGGDWMELGRFFVPIAPFLSIFMALFLIRLPQKFSLIGVFLICLIQIGAIYKYSVETSLGQNLADAINSYNNFGIAEGAENFSWFERTNLDHMRDIPSSYHMNIIISQLLEHQDSVVLMGPQAGFVMYYATMEHFGELRFIDEVGLADRTVMDCDALSEYGVVSDDGFAFPLSKLVEVAEEINAVCDLPLPDIYFALDLPTSNAQVSVAYHLAYLQEALWVDRNYFFPTEQFIAVRNDLVPYLSSDYQAGVLMQTPRPQETNSR